MSEGSLKDQILEINRDYLGPAAERFVDRQIATHLEKNPDKLTRADLAKLIDWFKLSFSLLTKDNKLIEEYTSRLTMIAKGKGDEGLGRHGA